MRLPFLLLTPVSVTLGLGAAFFGGQPLNSDLFVFILAGALLAHVSVNLLNEYADCKSGLDLRTVRTSFSGGSGALVDNPTAAKTVAATGLLALFLVALIGFYLIRQTGPEILPIGLLGALIVLTYTPWINHHPWICLIAPGLGFGPLMVGGTSVVLTGQYSVEPFLVSLVPFFLVNNLLLLNQYPDVAADQSIGRDHFPIHYGVERSNRIYTGFTLSAALTIIGGVVLQMIPVAGLSALLPLLPALFIRRALGNYREDTSDLPVLLGSNVAVVAVTPLVLSIALAFG